MGTGPGADSVLSRHTLERIRSTGRVLVGLDTTVITELPPGFGEGDATRGGAAAGVAGATNTSSRMSEAAATAAEVIATCPRRDGSDVAPSRSWITSAQLVRKVRELRDAERAG